MEEFGVNTVMVVACYFLRIGAGDFPPPELSSPLWAYTMQVHVASCPGSPTLFVVKINNWDRAGGKAIHVPTKLMRVVWDQIQLHTAICVHFIPACTPVCLYKY